MLEKVELDEGAIMLGALSLVICFFADDIVLLARSISDLQMLLNAFSDFCNILHEQIALDKTEVALFSPKSCIFFVRDDAEMLELPCRIPCYGCRTDR